MAGVRKVSSSVELISPQKMTTATGCRISVPGRPAGLLGGVRPQRELTLYARAGDTFAVGCGLVVLIAICIPARIATK